MNPPTTKKTSLGVGGVSTELETDIKRALWVEFFMKMCLLKALFSFPYETNDEWSVGVEKEFVGY